MDTEGNTPLDDILSNSQEPVEAEPAETAPEPSPAPETPPDGPVRDENGRFVAKTGVEDTAPPADQLPKEEFAGLKDERRKRQEIERERDELRAQLEAYKTPQQPKEPPAPPPSIWEDEDGWQQHFGAQIAQQASLNAKLDMSEMLARQSNPDFDDMKTHFLQMAEQNPAIVQQALSDPHPWDKAYKIAKNAATMAELGATDIDTLKAKLREELMAEMQAQPPARPGIPPTLTGERNVGGRSGPAWTGPASLDDLLA